MSVELLTPPSSESFSSRTPQRYPHHDEVQSVLLTQSIKVVMLGSTTESLEIGDLPIVSFDMRATHLFRRMRNAMKNIKPVMLGWKPRPGSGWQVGIRLFKLNSFVILMEIALAAFVAVLVYVPAFFLKRLIAYLETDPERLHIQWGILFALGLFVGGIAHTLGGCLVSRLVRVRMFNTIFQQMVNSGPSVLQLSRSGCVCNSIPSCMPRRLSERILLPLEQMVQGRIRRTNQPPRGTPKRRTKMTSLQRHRS